LRKPSGSSFNRAVAAIVAVVALGVAFVLLNRPPTSLAFEATPQSAAPVVIASEVLGRASPMPVMDPELALGRVTIMPGAVIPVHHHPGTQIGAVVQGTLTYSVFTGRVEWHRAHEPGLPHLIGPGETVNVEAGDALVETPDSIHQGRNDGEVPVVIYLSTLFPAGAPRAIVDAATPTP
jgi:quercetin dioxygenase-like cupin family protein